MEYPLCRQLTGAAERELDQMFVCNDEPTENFHLWTSSGFRSILEFFVLVFWPTTLLLSLAFK